MKFLSPYVEFDDLPEGPTMPTSVKKAIESLQQQGAPDDLWQQLDAAMQEVAAKPGIPANAFTRKDFQAKYKLGEGQAKRRLRVLMDAGKIEKRGNGFQTHYVLTKT